VTEQPETYAATVRLRGRSGPLPIGVFWPPHRPRQRRLLVALDADPERARALCVRTGRVVLAVAQDHPLALDDLGDLLAWAAERAAELGARPHDVLVTGAGPAPGVAELLRWSGVEGWPRLAVLDDSDS
jgi:hypothetical protein